MFLFAGILALFEVLLVFGGPGYLADIHCSSLAVLSKDRASGSRGPILPLLPGYPCPRRAECHLGSGTSKKQCEDVNLTSIANVRRVASEVVLPHLGRRFLLPGVRTVRDAQAQAQDPDFEQNPQPQPRMDEGLVNGIIKNRPIIELAIGCWLIFGAFMSNRDPGSMRRVLAAFALVSFVGGALAEFVVRASLPHIPPSVRAVNAALDRIVVLQYVMFSPGVFTNSALQHALDVPSDLLFAAVAGCLVALSVLLLLQLFLALFSTISRGVLLVLAASAASLLAGILSSAARLDLFNVVLPVGGLFAIAKWWSVARVASAGLFVISNLLGSVPVFFATICLVLVLLMPWYNSLSAFAGAFFAPLEVRSDVLLLFALLLVACAAAAYLWRYRSVSCTFDALTGTSLLLDGMMRLGSLHGDYDLLWDLAPWVVAALFALTTEPANDFSRHR